MRQKFLICVTLTLISTNYVLSMPDAISEIETIPIYELYTKMISPENFNYTSVQYEQFRYRPSLLGRAELPSWMNFQFSKERNLGYLYGSPTLNYANRKVSIEIVALNKLKYETRRIVVNLKIVYKKPPAYQIEMKVTNLNWVHLTDSGRVRNLKGIFTEELWPESSKDLTITFMESAVKLGARLPLKPQNREGVIVHLGSNEVFSNKLIELGEEIKPLAKLTTCTFKKTKVQQIFFTAGFQVDWCAFKLVNHTMSASPHKSMLHKKSIEIWNGISKYELPERSYSEELALAIAIPSVFFAFLVALLTIVLCFNHEKFEQPKANEPVQMVQYSGSNNNQPKTATLKSLHDPYSDNLSLTSDSPSSTIFFDGSPKLNPYFRPKPPAYDTRTTVKPIIEGPTSSSSGVHFERDI